MALEIKTMPENIEVLEYKSNQIVEAYQKYYKTSLIAAGANLSTSSEFIFRNKNIFLFRRKNRHPHVGRYLLLGHNKNRFAIDASDPGKIASNSDYRWCDVYFKSNYWPSINYPSKVKPIINGNGLLGKAEINFLSKLRESKKNYDLIFISRLWGGTEHNIRLFEELANLQCNKKLIAIFSSKDKLNSNLYKRLQSVGVECTYNLLEIRSLWQELSSSKIVFFRAGKHLCIPWRMLDLLCMGACILMDAEPIPQWPYPLKERVNFVHCGINRPLDTSPAQMNEYSNVANSALRLLDNDKLISLISSNNIKYFDTHANFQAVGNYIIRNLLHHEP